MFLQQTLVWFVLVGSAFGHESRVNRRYFKDWAQPQDHPVNALFKRGLGDYPAIGSPEWSAKYPKSGGTPDRSQTPKEWTDALNAAIAAGKIPNTPRTTAVGFGNPTYPSGVSPTSPDVCSSTYQCRGTDSIVWDGPEGTFGLNFDDGPYPATNGLVDFLRNNNEIATHFMIGNNILNHPQEFQKIVEYGGDCAVHTWSHPYMTSLSNEDILAELGWTMQIIHDSTGGKVPRMWRPPTGDSDLRVRAIAKEVFGMTTVIWNQDTADWTISEGRQSVEGIGRNFDGWLKGSKNPGLNVLEHELTDQTVQAFIQNYPKIKSNGWRVGSLAQLLEGGAYQNVNAGNIAAAPLFGDKGGTTTNSSSSAHPSSTSSANSASMAASANVTGAVNDKASSSAMSSRSLSLLWLSIVLSATLFIGL